LNHPNIITIHEIGRINGTVHRHGICRGPDSAPAHERRAD
jgi:hypothetical protein